MVELYLDNLNDLLYTSEINQSMNGTQSSALAGKRPKLDLREDHDTGMINILNVCMHNISSLEEVQEKYQMGI